MAGCADVHNRAIISCMRLGSVRTTAPDVAIAGVALALWTVVLRFLGTWLSNTFGGLGVGHRRFSYSGVRGNRHDRILVLAQGPDAAAPP